MLTNEPRFTERKKAMRDCKRVSVMEAVNSCCMSKRRRILDDSSEQLLPELGDRCLSLNLSLNSVSSCSCFSEDRFLVSCSSSNGFGQVSDDDDIVICKDLETKSFETVESSGVNGKLRASQEMESPAINFSISTEKQKSADPPMKTPPLSEIEDFFAEAEKLDQKRFSEKYNFDIVKEVPMEGRYQWILLKQ